MLVGTSMPSSRRNYKAKRKKEEEEADRDHPL
jgi:hypothetical protein